MAGESPAVILYDADANPMAVSDGVAVPANTKGILLMGETEEGKAERLRLEEDGKIKVASQPPVPPPGTTPFQLSQNDAELVITGTGSPHITDSAVIDDTLNLYLQIIIIGSQGDPAIDGTRIEIVWVEGATPTEHIISRIYVAQQTIATVVPDINKARDGTQLTGDGSTTKLRIKRSRLAQQGIEVDAEVRGYIK